jgi:hypothetical protein
LIAVSACAGAGITGRVHDADGRPLKDVAVSAGAKVKTYSNDTGEFSLEPGGAAGPVRLLFELPGYYPEPVICDSKGGVALDVALTSRAVVKEAVKVVASRLDLSWLPHPPPLRWPAPNCWNACRAASPSTRRWPACPA